MGLENFKTSDSSEEYSIGSVKTRKKISNVTINKKTWTRILYHNPEMGTVLASGMDEKSVKALVQLMDQIIQGDIEKVDIDEEKLKGLEQHRDEVVDTFLKE